MTVFLVRRKAKSDCSRGDIPDPNVQYLGTFTTRAAADEFARRVDWEEKRTGDPATFDPFHYDATWDEVSSLPPTILRDWLRDENIEPPEPPEPPPPHKPHLAVSELSVWRNWWSEIAAGKELSAAQWERVWLGLNRYSLFEVEESEPDAALRSAARAEPPPTVVYAVVHRSWEYDDCWYCGANSALTVYRTKHAAETARRAAEGEAGTGGENWNGGPNEFVVIELPLDQVAE